jgi:hypothetical protein
MVFEEFFLIELDQWFSYSYSCKTILFLKKIKSCGVNATRIWREMQYTEDEEEE